jgi:hypothetical protein
MSTEDEKMRVCDLLKEVVLSVCLAILLFTFVQYWYSWISPGSSYLCKGCSDEAYRRIATRCYGIKELFIRGGESVSFVPSDRTFYDNATCTPSDRGLIWVNITSDKPVRVIIHSKAFEGTGITYGCINMKGVTITALQDTRIVVEIREITPCIYCKRYVDFHRLHEALPNLYDDRDCP